MKIETKFNVGDTVYCIIEDGWNSDIKTLDRGAYIVRTIRFQAYFNQNTNEEVISVQYYVQPKLYASMQAQVAEECNVFADFKEAKLTYVNNES